MVPNPFDLPGPQFLGFYGMLTLVVLGVTAGIKKLLASSPVTPRMERDLAEDPYAIAYLREGKRHLVSVTVLSLLDRNLLQTDGDTLLNPQGMAAVEIARRPLEQAILQCCMVPTTMNGLMANDNVTLTIERFAATLRGKGLLFSEDERLQWYIVVGTAAIVLLGTSLTKIALALQRGHHNIGILVVLTFFTLSYVVGQAGKERAATGDALLKQMTNLFGGLKSRASSLRLGGETPELVMLAAVFGFSALPGVVQAMLQPVHVGQYPSQSSSDNSSSCSSGSSCGGGGCGGGCGGCS